VLSQHWAPNFHLVLYNLNNQILTFSRRVSFQYNVKESFIVNSAPSICFHLKSFCPIKFLVKMGAYPAFAAVLVKESKRLYCLFITLWILSQPPLKFYHISHLQFFKFFFCDFDQSSSEEPVKAFVRDFTKFHH
jgi:hypothetical protein